MRRTSRHNPLVQHGPSKVYIDPDFGELVELVHDRPNSLRFIIGKEHYGVASGHGSTHTNISAALRSMFGPGAAGYALILNTDASYPMEESEWSMHPRVPGITADNFASFSEGVEALPVQVQRDLEDMRKIWSDVYGEEIQRRAMRRSMRDAGRTNPYGSARRNSSTEGERHSSLEEQAASALLWERIRKAKSQKEALAHYRAALAAAEDEKRLSASRKKAAARKPKPVYTKEYLAAKGMPRRNPAKVPVQLLTRSTLDAVGKAFNTGKRVPESNRDAAVLRDFMIDTGIEAIGPEGLDVKPGAHLTRWIVQEAIDAVELFPQRPDTRPALAAAKAWVADPSEANRARALAVGERFGNSYESIHADAVAHSAHYAAFAAAYVDDVSSNGYSSSEMALMAIRNAVFAITFDSAGPNAYYDQKHPNQQAHMKAVEAVRQAASNAGAAAVKAAELRFRVLAALDAVGALPEPPVQRNNPRR
jgi:hypothetical protein